jgi:predicted small integral membrane protein
MGVWEYARRAAPRVSGSCASRQRAATGFSFRCWQCLHLHLAWLGLVGPNLWWALGLSVVYAIGVFRYV